MLYRLQQKMIINIQIDKFKVILDILTGIETFKDLETSQTHNFDILEIQNFFNLINLNLK